MCNTQFGYFNPSYKTVDQIKSNLKNLILTQKGSRIMQPMFGTTLYNIIFEQVEVGTIEEYVKADIERAIRMWLPVVVIKDVTIYFIHDKNSIDIAIKYKINIPTEEGREEELNITFE